MSVLTNNSSINNRVHLITDYALIAFFVLFIGGATVLSQSDLFAVLIFMLLIGLFIIRRKKLDACFFVVFLIWALVNLLSFVVNKVYSFPYISFFGTSIRLLMSYFFIKVIGSSFFDKLSRFSYILVIASLVIFSFQLLFPSVFYKAGPYLNIVTQSEQKASGGWCFFYYMFNAWAPTRNCGFVWEPGGYALALIFLLYYRLFRTGFKLDIQSIIIIIALITTFSTAGYLALATAILFLCIYHSRQIYPVLLLPLFVILFVLFYRNTPFMKSKIDNYLRFGTQSYDWSFEDKYITRVSRFGIATIALDGSIQRPLGNGIMGSSYILRKYGPVEGPNSLAEILQVWGWPGIIALYVCLYSFGKLFTKSRMLILSFLISFSIVLFSNPFQFKYLVYAILFYSLLFKRSNYYSFGTRIKDQPSKLLLN